MNRHEREAVGDRREASEVPCPEWQSTCRSRQRKVRKAMGERVEFALVVAQVVIRTAAQDRPPVDAVPPHHPVQLRLVSDLESPDVSSADRPKKRDRL